MSKITNTTPNNIPISYVFRGGLSVTAAIFSYHDGNLKVLVEKKKEEPITGELGLPGRLMLVNEDTDEALNKLLIETIGFDDFYKKQLTAFSEVGRHPLGRVVSFGYYCLVPWERFEHLSMKELSWHNVTDIPKLCYDHNEMFNSMMKRFCKGLNRHPNVFELLSEEFFISDVIKIYEQAFSKKINIANFRKQIKKSKLIHPLGKFSQKENLQGRRPELYYFDKAEYKQIKENIQFNF